MWKFRFDFQKKDGLWSCFLPFNENNLYNIKGMLYCDIADLYIKNQNDKNKFRTFIINQQNVVNYNQFLNNVDHFVYNNNIKFQINRHTQDYSPTRKLIAKVDQYAIAHLLKKINFNNSVKLGTGIKHDVVCNGVKIDVKTKNGNSKNFSKNYEITTAYNTLQNNNDSEYYCFSFCSKRYLEENNIIHFLVAGIINKRQFYSYARKRQIGQVLCGRDGKPTLQFGKQMIAKKNDYVTYAEYLYSLQSIFL